MVGFIGDTAEELMDSNSSDRVRLLVGADEDLDETRENIQELGGKVKKTIGRTTMLAILQERQVSALAELGGVVSVEVDERDVHTQDSEVFRYQTSSMM